MPDATIFSIPRRRMAISAYAVPGSELIKMRDVGVINSGEVTFDRETNEYRAVDISGPDCREYVADRNNTAGSGVLTVEMMSTEAANLGLMLSSAVTTKATGPATEEIMPTMADGEVVQLNLLPDPTTVVITDSDASPATLVLGTDYEWVAQAGGLLRILNIGSYTQPFKVNYSAVDEKSIKPMSDLEEYFYIVLSGANERDACKGELERFYRCHVSDAQVKRLHEAADQQVPLPMTVAISIDRDPARAYEFGEFTRAEAA